MIKYNLQLRKFIKNSLKTTFFEFLFHTAQKNDGITAII